MKKILYYISDHGKGHATRSIAIIRELIKSGYEVYVRNSNVKKFLDSSLPKTPIYSGKTDVGPILNNFDLTVDKDKSKLEISSWINNINSFADKETRIIKKVDPQLIISDISAMPFLAAKKNEIRSIGISNFSWYDVLKFLPKDQLHTLLRAYDEAEMVLQLKMGTKMEHFKLKKKIGFISRKNTISRKLLREKLGISDNQIVVLFAMGNSSHEFDLEINNDVKILSMSTRVDKKLRPLDCSNGVEGQEIVNASDLIICKLGYGLISECLTAGTPFFYVLDPNHLEQKAMADFLTNQRLGNEIDINKIRTMKIDKKFIQTIPKVKKENNDVQSIIKYIHELLFN